MADGSPSGVRCIVDDRLHALLMRTVGTAVECVVRLDTVPNDLAPAMLANGRELMDPTIQAVERVRDASGHDLEREMVVVAAHFTLGHCLSTSGSRSIPNKPRAPVRSPGRYSDSIAFADRPRTLPRDE